MNDATFDIELNVDQSNQSSFPPGCRVYIVNDTDEYPPSIDAQGVVDSVILRRTPGSSNAFEECYKVTVKCKNDDGKVYGRGEVVEHSKLRYKNGCSVYIMNVNSLDETLLSGESMAKKEGIILGFCDIPEAAIENENKYWYCVKELHGNQNIHHQILPKQVSFRHPKYSDDDEINSSLECSGAEEAEIENSKTDQILKSSPKEILGRSEGGDDKKSLTSSINSSTSPQMKQSSPLENHEKRVVQNERITTRLSSRSYIEWDGDDGTIIKNTKHVIRDVVGDLNRRNRSISTSRDNHVTDKGDPNKVQCDEVPQFDDKKPNLVSDSISESDVVDDDLEKKGKKFINNSRTLGHATQINNLKCMKIPTVNLGSPNALGLLNHNELSNKRHQDILRSPRKRMSEGDKDDNSVEFHQRGKRQNNTTGNQKGAPVPFELFTCRLELPIPKQHAFGKLKMYYYSFKVMFIELMLF